MSTNLDDFLVERLVEAWRSRGAKPSVGCSVETIDAFERRNGVHFTADVRAYLEIANGMAVGDGPDSDCNGFSFWSLDHWSKAEEELSHQGESADEPWLLTAFAFADYMTRSWAYVIALVSVGEVRKGEVFRIGGPGIAKCADSFAAFVKMYLDNSPGLY